MPSIADHQSNLYTKLLLLGDAKSGKTTSLESLVNAGYHLRILDMDNLLDGLKDKVMRDCPEMAKNVEFRTLRDKYKTGPLGPAVDGTAKAFIDAMKMLDNWKYDDVDLGTPKAWGPETILVVDSLTRLCDAAFAYHRSLAGPKTDGRMIFFAAQQAVEMTLANLTSEHFETNVIVVCHGIYQDLPDGTTKIFPSGLGQKLSPKIPSYFPVYVRYKNLAGKRTIQIESDVMIDLAMPKLQAFAGKTLPIETGLATIFETLRGKAVKIDPPIKPKSVTLRRV
jgi:AAA domain-containing protein